jgi:hypothetical protein
MPISLPQAAYDQATAILTQQRDAELSAVNSESQQISAAQQRMAAAQSRADAINAVLAGLEVNH